MPGQEHSKGHLAGDANAGPRLHEAISHKTIFVSAVGIDTPRAYFNSR
jgi:hypothetical protein